MKRLGIALGATLTALALTAAPASAREVVIDDPAGDAGAHSIDFTKVTVNNNNDHVSVQLRLENAEPGGTLIISLNPREARGVRLISEYDPVGHTTNYVVDGAFGESHPAHQPKQCRGFRVRWSMERPIVTLQMPSRCMNGGDYGAIKVRVLTEGDSGGDADYAGPTGWIPRG